MALLEIEGLVFSADGRPILQGVDISLEYGEVLALLGPNGTGKSTLGYIIMGCGGYRPSAGTVRFRGEDLLPLPLHERARRGICLAWQEPVRFEGVGVRKFLSLRPSPAGQAAAAEEGPSRLLSAVGLDPRDYLGRMVDRRLSGGERKRIELASLLGLPLSLAILDEPDSGIDMLSLDDIGRVVRRFAERGTAVLLITHREEIARVADRAAQICRGRIELTGAPALVAASYRGKSCPTCAGDVCPGAGCAEREGEHA